MYSVLFHFLFKSNEYFFNCEMNPSFGLICGLLCLTKCKAY